MPIDRPTDQPRRRGAPATMVGACGRSRAISTPRRPCAPDTDTHTQLQRRAPWHAARPSHTPAMRGQTRCRGGPSSSWSAQAHAPAHAAPPRRRAAPSAAAAAAAASPRTRAQCRRCLDWALFRLTGSWVRRGVRTPGAPLLLLVRLTRAAHQRARPTSRSRSQTGAPSWSCVMPSGRRTRRTCGAAVLMRRPGRPAVPVSPSPVADCWRCAGRRRPCAPSVADCAPPTRTFR